MASDNFIGFWFRYVFPYRSDIEIGNLSEVLMYIDKSLPALISSTYENVAADILRKLRVIPFERIGRWWDRHGEIDLVALHEENKEILFGEVKWSDKKAGTNSYYELQQKSEKVVWHNDERKNRYILFSKSGFTKDMIELARKEKVYLVEKDQLSALPAPTW